MAGIHAWAVLYFNGKLGPASWMGNRPGYRAWDRWNSHWFRTSAKTYAKVGSMGSSLCSCNGGDHYYITDGRICTANENNVVFIEADLYKNVCLVEQLLNADQMRLMVQKGKNKIYISTIVIFWIIFAFFILTTYLSIFSMYLTSYGFYSYLPLLPFFIGWKFLFVMLIQALLGIALIFLVSRAKFTKISKAFLIITGSSAACIIFSITSLSWIVYGLFVELFGASPNSGWAANGTIILFQLALLAGAIGSIVLMTKKKVIL